MLNLENLKIRTIQKEDKMDIIKLLDIINESDNAQASITEELLDYFINTPKFQKGIFLAYLKNELIGYGTCISTNTNESEISIDISIHPQYRDSEAIEKIYDALVNEANEYKYKELQASAKIRLKYLTSFYTKKGFKEYEYMWKMNLSLKDKNVSQDTFDGITFTEATKDDITKFTDVMNNGFKEDKEDKFTEDVFESRFVDPDSKIYLMEKDNELIAASIINYNEKFSLGYISNLAVYKKYRGQGYGKKLLSLNISEIKKNGMETATLHVVGTNESALNLYRKAGFKEFDTVASYKKVRD